MAYLKRIKRSTKKSGIKFYYYSLIKSVNWSKDKYISLETTDYKDALERHEEVEDKEIAIKRGVQYSFSWENESNRGRAKIVKHSVKYGRGRMTMGGDNNTSELALIPLEDLANEFRKE